MRPNIYIFLLVLAGIFLPGLCLSQTVQVTLGPDNIAENQTWTITVTVQNDRLKSYDNFPDIQGFRKRGQSTQSTTNIVNGQVSSSQSVIMTYLPEKQGNFTIPSFTMKVNDKPVSVAGKKVTVGPASQQQRDPFKSFFDRSTDDFFDNGETEFVDVKEDAFLALTTNKDEVYVGEGFNATLSFFVSQENRAPLQFYELGKQLADILKKIKPVNCWKKTSTLRISMAKRLRSTGKTTRSIRSIRLHIFPLTQILLVFPVSTLK